MHLQLEIIDLNLYFSKVEFSINFYLNILDTFLFTSFQNYCWKP